MDWTLRTSIRPGLHCSSRADVLSETYLQTRTLCTNTFSGQVTRLQCTGGTWSVTQTLPLQSTMAERCLGSYMRWTGYHFHQLQRRSLSWFTAPATRRTVSGEDVHANFMSCHVPTCASAQIVTTGYSRLLRLPASLTNVYTLVLTKCAKSGGGNNWFIVGNKIIVPTLEIQVLPRSICKVEQIQGFGPPPNMSSRFIKNVTRSMTFHCRYGALAGLMPTLKPTQFRSIPYSITHELEVAFIFKCHLRRRRKTDGCNNMHYYMFIITIYNFTTEYKTCVNS